MKEKFPDPRCMSRSSQVDNNRFEREQDDTEESNSDTLLDDYLYHRITEYREYVAAMTGGIQALTKIYSKLGQKSRRDRDQQIKSHREAPDEEKPPSSPQQKN